MIYFNWSGWEFRINRSDKLFIGQIRKSRDFDSYLRRKDSPESRRTRLRMVIATSDRTVVPDQTLCFTPTTTPIQS